MANSTRIILTGLFQATIGKAGAEEVYHALAGWLTMPLALVLLYIEYRLLMRLFIEPPDAISETVDPDFEKPHAVACLTEESRMPRLIPLVVGIPAS